ncbi:MAG: hypothetical protein JST68_28695 [Bacteroidetes bacterium]|nr:hypothetical protein [Bacteroidota bacterium]
MSVNNLSKSAVLMVVLVVAVIGSWEIYLRQKGVTVAYDDNGAMWSDKRAMVYEPADKADVFIGASRIKYDLDIPTWEQTTGRRAIQLSLEGHSPLPFLQDLADDPKFKGRLVVDVTELLYFSDAPNFLAEAKTDVEYYKKQTPAQRASFLINSAVESQFVFLDQHFLSLNVLLSDHLDLPNRPGIMGDLKFPIDFWRQEFTRQTKMTPRFVADTAMRHQVEGQWSFILDLGAKAPKPKVDPVPGIIQRSKEAVDKIRARGGEVVFVRTPSSGKFWAVEQMAFPRARFFDALVKETGCKGYFFTDYPGLARYEPAEWSHLSPEDAVGFTKELIKVLPPSFTN